MLPRLGDHITTQDRGRTFNGRIIAVDKDDPAVIMTVWQGIEQGPQIARLKKDMFIDFSMSKITNISPRQWSLPDDTVGFPT